MGINVDIHTEQKIELDNLRKFLNEEDFEAARQCVEFELNGNLQSRGLTEVKRKIKQFIEQVEGQRQFLHMQSEVEDVSEMNKKLTKLQDAASYFAKSDSDISEFDGGEKKASETIDLGE